MPSFPQIGTGSLCQYPIKKSLQYRTITNLAEDHSRVVLEDPNASAIIWNLAYVNLTDTEKNTLDSFFEGMSGRLQSFSFFDPVGNLLQWSEDFSQNTWQKSTFLQCISGVADPLGTTRATSVSNSGSGSLALTQTVSIPTSYLCCFSAFLRSASNVVVSLTRGSSSQSFSIGTVWRQIILSGTTTDGTDASTFGLTIPPGSSVEVFGTQVQVQLQPSTYVQTLDRSGVYTSTRFDSDSLVWTSDAPNNNACRIKLYSRLPL